LLRSKEPLERWTIAKGTIGDVSKAEESTACRTVTCSRLSGRSFSTSDD